jgi:hypothetical protein
VFRARWFAPRTARARRRPTDPFPPTAKLGASIKHPRWGALVAGWAGFVGCVGAGWASLLLMRRDELALGAMARRLLLDDQGSRPNRLRDTSSLGATSSRSA